MQESSAVDALLPEPIQKMWKYSSSHGNDTGEAASGLASSVRFFTEQLPGSGSAPQSPLPRFMSPALCQLKDELNLTKGGLSRFEIGKWSAHTSHTQPSGGVVADVSRAYNAELCTNAWCKMYEILATFELVEGLTQGRCHSANTVNAEVVAPSDDGVATNGQQQLQQQQQMSLSSVHLCEAPGAFVCALNHLLKTAGIDCEHSWLASTLNPWYEGNRLNSMVNDDRFILHTQEHWCFGKNQSGDILDVDNLQHIVNQALLQLGPVMLVTADGSFDCQDEPAEQERLVYSLLAAEVYSALLLLATGGAFVLKTFTAFETETTVLIYLLTVAFEEVAVFKPMTSKPGNSELYTVCRGYRGAAAWMTGSGDTTTAADAFKVAIQRGTPILDPLCLPATFLAQHTECCQAFKLWQEKTILSNIRLYNKMPWSMWRDRARKLQQHCCSLFRKLCRLKPISDDQKITGSLLSHSKEQPCARAVTGSRKRLIGSLEERSRQASMPWHQYVSFIGFYNVPPATASLRWITTSPCQAFPWLVVTGRSLECIGSSKFCDQELLEELSRFMLHAAEHPVSLMSLTGGSGLHDSVVQQLLLAASMHPNGKIPATVKVTPADVTSTQDVIPGDHLLLRIESAYDWLELEHRSHLLTSLLTLFKYIRHSAVCSSTDSCDDDEGDNAARWHTVVLPFSTLLTRFSVNCLYVLWNCFAEVSCVFADDYAEFAERPSGPLLHLCCRGRVPSRCPPSLAATIEQHLLDVSAACESADVTGTVDSNATRRRTVDVLEFIPIKTVLEDEKFMTFVMAANRVAVKRLINWLLAREQLALASSHAVAGPP